MLSSPAIHPPRSVARGAALAALRADPAARLTSGRELTRRRADGAAPEPLATGLEPLDRLLGGGLPRGRLVELVGLHSSGRFAAVMAAIAAATAGGETTALVDLGEGLEPAAAAAAGAVLERLLWVRPRNLKQAALSSEMLLNAGFPLVVLDLGQPPVAGGRGPQAVWLRLARAAASHGAALLVSAPYRASGTAAAAVVLSSRTRPAWSGSGGAPRLLTGFHSQLALDKQRGGGRPPGRALLTVRAQQLIDGRLPGMPARGGRAAGAA